MLRFYDDGAGGRPSPHISVILPTTGPDCEANRIQTRRALPR
jgi:hypothetical protein